MYLLHKTVIKDISVSLAHAREMEFQLRFIRWLPWDLCYTWQYIQQQAIDFEFVENVDIVLWKFNKRKCSLLNLFTLLFLPMIAVLIIN